MTKPENTDDYIAAFPAETQAKLQQIRKIIAEAAPGATEVISYSMPAFKLNGIVVWFGGHINHIGFYPKAAPIEIFKEDLKDYKTSKGAIQFPLNQPLPAALIKKIVQHRVQDNLSKSAKKK